LIGNTGGIELILNAMTQYVDHASFPNDSVSVLAALANEDSNKSRIVESGGIDTVVACMERYKTDANVQTAGCKVLGSLARQNWENVALIGQLGGFRALTESSTEHPDDGNVQEAFRTAILLFTRASVEQLT
jgi:hypothetical protein